MKKRINKIRAKLREEEVEAALLTFLPDIQWACGFSGSNGVLLVSRSEAHFLSDGRYAEQAREEVRGAQVHTPGYKIYPYMQEQGLLREADRVLFQADHVTVARLQKWNERFPAVSWQPGEQILTRLVASKEPDEIHRMRRAQQLTDAVFADIVDFIRPGMSEKEVAAEVVYQHLQRGADAMSFEPIVASGKQGALPHARPTAKNIASGDLVVIDMGCFLDGYASDMTRTVAVGRASDEARAVYRVVLQAQQAAIKTARAGMSSKALDKVARDVIEEEGYEEYFGHGLGHGLGLQVHEWPRLSYHVDDDLPERAVVTIEPGIYLPGQFGVRIEDSIVLHEEGCENLTGAPKEDLLII